MKKITLTQNLFQYLLFGLLLFPLVSNAQQLENNATTYTHESTVTLAPLLETDINLYKNSILYDRVLGLANLRDLTTVVDTDSDHFKRTWQELHNARLQPTNKHISLQTVNKITTHFQNQNIIPVGIINIDYTQFKQSVLEDFEEDRVTVLQLANRNRATAPSPYEDKHLFIASPVTKGSIKTTANTPVTFKTDLFVLDQAVLPLEQLEVRFNNVTKTILQNGNLTNTDFTFSFASSGVKTLQFKATYSNGLQRTSNAKVYVDIIHVSQRQNTPTTILATEAFKGYNEAADCGGSCYGKGEYQVFLGKNNTQLTKPLIILDGFDPGDKRKINNGKGSIVYLINNDDKEDNMLKFYNEGFDVVILNFHNYTINTTTETIYNPFNGQYINVPIEIKRDGGADYIERNANVLKALINDLNGKLVANGSTEKIKIIGPSMGGLISRVALTQME